MTRAHAFDRLALPWSLSLLVGVGLGSAEFLTTTDHIGWAMILYAIALIVFVVFTSRSPLNSPHNWDQRDIYSSAASWVPAGVMLIWMFIFPIVGHTLIIDLLISIVVAVSFALMARYSHRLTAFPGRKHAREVLAKDVTLTEEQIDAARQHVDLLSILYTLGAVEGIRVRTRLVAQALNTSATMILRDTRDPRSAGLVYTSAVDAGDDEGKIFLALTAEGVHALARITQATPQRA